MRSGHPPIWPAREVPRYWLWRAVPQQTPGRGSATIYAGAATWLRDVRVSIHQCQRMPGAATRCGRPRAMRLSGRSDRPYRRRTCQLRRPQRSRHACLSYVRYRATQSTQRRRSGRVVDTDARSGPAMRAYATYGTALPRARRTPRRGAAAEPGAAKGVSIGGRSGPAMRAYATYDTALLRAHRGGAAAELSTQAAAAVPPCVPMLRTVSRCPEPDAH